MSGFYLMHRGWQDHPVFGNEPYSRRDAFEWLIANASHKPRRIPVLGRVVEIQRGQLCYSLRYIAKAWRWDEAKVRRFIARLEKERMIVTETDAGQTRITICNYETYQAPEKQTDAAPTQERRSTDAAPTQIRKNDNNGKKEEAVVVGAREPFHDVGRQVLALCGDSPNLLHYGRVRKWLDDGCDPDLDIVPTVRRLMAKRNGQAPSTLNYFDQAIADAKASREKSMPEGKTDDLTIPDFLDRRPKRGAAAALAGLARSSGGG